MSGQQLCGAEEFQKVERSVVLVYGQAIVKTHEQMRA